MENRPFSPQGHSQSLPRRRWGRVWPAVPEELLAHAGKVALGMVVGEVGQRRLGVLDYRLWRLMVHCVVWASRSQPGALQPWQLAGHTEELGPEQSPMVALRTLDSTGGNASHTKNFRLVIAMLKK